MLSVSLATSIVAKDLGKKYRNEWIFKSFNYTFESGNIYAITGANGSGKSTLLQTLWSQTLPTTGSVSFFNNDIEIETQNIFENVAIVAPYLDLIEEFTLIELIQFHFSLRKPVSGISKSEIVGLLELNRSQDKQIGNYSSGMRQRVKLGLAILTEKKALFLDEPFTNLDEASCQWAENLLSQFPSALTLIASNDKKEYKKANQILNMQSYK